EAGLSFLGLGTAPPTPSWGRMLQESQQFLGVADHLAAVPGVAIAVAVLGFNLLGDGLRDVLDPRLAGVAAERADAAEQAASAADEGTHTASAADAPAAEPALEVR